MKSVQFISFVIIALCLILFSCKNPLSVQNDELPAAVPAPAAPSGLTVTSGNSITTISWPAINEATSYNIYWSTTSGVTKTNGTTITKAVSPYTHTGLSNGTKYYYVVTALNGTSESIASAQIDATPQIPSPGAPTGLTAVSGNAKTTISWTATSGATSYNLYWSNTTGVTPATGTKIEGVTSPYTHAGLTNTTNYYYILTAVNAGGESVASGQASARPEVPIAGAPTGLTAAAGNAKTTITWTSVSGATGYNLYWSTTSGVTPATGTKISGVTSPYTHTGLTNSTNYYYVLTAVNVGGESVASNQVSAKPEVPIAGAPTGLTATAGNAKTTISWTSVSGATGYNLYWSTASGVTPVTGTKISGVSSPYTHTGLTNETNYYYVITAVNPRESPPPPDNPARNRQSRFLPLRQD